MAFYSEKVMEHFKNPKNVGEIPDADGKGEIGNPVCGDMMTFYIKVKDDKIEDIKFKTFGCGAAIAVASMVSEMAKGKHLKEAQKITNEMVAEELGGLPPNKMHCSNLGADALHNAIDDYLENKKNAKCRCPLCENELTHSCLEPIFCQKCKVKLTACEKCGKIFNEKIGLCPQCKP